MSTPTITAIIPTQGRPTLEWALDSVRDQLLPGDEVIVVIDTHEMDINTQRAIVRRVEPYPYQIHTRLHDAGAHHWGHPQCDHGQTLAKGDWIVANDDDDVFTPGAFAAIRQAIAYAETPRPLLFRFKPYFADNFLIWHTAGPEWIRQGHIGGHCLVQPNVPEKVGQRAVNGTYRYESDFDWIISTLANWAPIDPLWCDHVIAEQRPREDR